MLYSGYAILRTDATPKLTIKLFITKRKMLNHNQNHTIKYKKCKTTVKTTQSNIKTIAVKYKKYKTTIRTTQWNTKTIAINTKNTKPHNKNQTNTKTIPIKHKKYKTTQSNTKTIAIKYKKYKTTRSKPQSNYSLLRQNYKIAKSFRASTTLCLRDNV